MSKVILTGFIIVPDANLETVKQELPIHTALTRNESGCLRFDVTPDKHSPNRFDVYEEFADRAAFDAHQARVQNSRWGQVTKDVERHYEIIQ